MNHTRNLSLLGVGVDGDVQPHDRYPALTPGNHLRWAFAPHRGFPQNGYYVYRRTHTGPRGAPVCLSDAVPEKVRRRGLLDSVTTPDGETFGLSDPSAYAFTDDFVLDADRTVRPGADGLWEFELGADRPLTVTLPEAAHRVDLSLAVEGGSATVTASAGDRTVDEATVTDSGVVTLTAAEMTAVRVVGAEVTLVELACYTLTAEATTGWSLLTDAPVTLPLTHPDYPAAPGPEHLGDARATARGRVEYGDPTRVAPDATTRSADGTASVTAGSPFVTGHGTDWTAGDAGAVFSLASDDTGYVVAEVLDAERLVLGRAYDGPSATTAGYDLTEDPFGQLHDYLTHLVDEGTAAGGTASRVVPEPVDSAGTVRRSHYDRTVDGAGTNWTDDVAGTTLRVALDTGGTVTVFHGLPAAVSRSADWDESLVGGLFRLDGEREQYTVTDVQSFPYDGQSVGVLTLDRPVSGPHYPSQGRAYDVFEPDGVEVSGVTDATTLELADPYPGPDDGSDRNYLLTPSLAGGGETDAPASPFQYPMDLALVASLDPGFAQALGLYWVDETADRTTGYDYLVVADRGLEQYLERFAPRLSGTRIDPADLPSILPHPLVDWALALDVRVGDAGVRDAPTDAATYPLPPVRGRTDVGLRWDQGDAERDADSAALYYLWRQEGTTPPTDPPAPAAYEVRTRDGADPTEGFEAAAEPIPRTTAEARDPVDLPGWPDAPLHTVDTDLADGWYSYRLSSMDLFGRHSPVSAPATWTDPDGSPHGHAAGGHAVEVAPDLPPPPPTGVEGAALDPADPFVRADDAYDAWRAANEGAVGLRVRWLWTEERAASAPDVDAFRLHFEPGRLNAEFGEITAASAVGDRYRVETTIDTDAATDEFVGATLQVGGRGFPVVASDGDPLRVDVAPADPTAPEAVPDGGTVAADATQFAPIEAGAECTVSVPAAYARGTATMTEDVVRVDGADRTVVEGTDTGWSAALETETFRTVDDVESYAVHRVDSPTRLLLDRVYDPPAEMPAKHRTYAISNPAGVDYTDANEWDQHLGTVQYGDAAPRSDGAAWPRVYETFVTLADTTGFDPSVTDPKAFGNVSVSAVDSAGREGLVGAPVTVARVHRETPDPPAVPVLDADFEWASAPDYHGTSRYTVRWERPTDGLGTHVVRTLDESLFATDWRRRRAAVEAGRTDELPLAESDHERFPHHLRPDAGDDDATARSKRESRETVVAELDALTAFATAADEDGAMAAYRNLRDPPDDGSDASALAPTTLRVLAGLPGNESAFAQVTVDALDPDESPNRAGPDTGPGESYPQGTLCAYVDEFDGGSSNCYLYRTVTVDPAGNRSDQRDAAGGERMSYPTPGVKTPDVVPPKAPVVTRILAGSADDATPGDRKITAWLAPTTDPDLAGYRAYRTTTEEDARDLRSMDEVASDVVPAATGETDWTDEDVTPFVTQYYRFVAVDEAGNVSSPSAVVSARAFDDRRPDPPTWETATVDDATGTATLSWTLDGPDHRPLLQRKPPADGEWTNATGWLAPGTETATDPDRDGDEQYEYRLLVVATDGRQNDRYEERRV